MSAYTDFVRQHIKSAPGATQKEKMRHVAAMWRKQRGGATAASAGPAPTHKTQLLKGGAAKRRRAMAPAGPVSMAGGRINPLGASNQVGDGFFSDMLGPLGGPLKMIGLGAADDDQRGDGFFDDLADGFSSVVGPASKIITAAAPLIPLLL